MMKRTIIAVLCLAAFAATSIAGGTQGTASKHSSRAQKYIEKKMAEEPFRSGLTGILAVTADGDTLAKYNSLRKLIPASNTKLISTGLALNALGADYKFRTRLGYTGTIEDGILSGDLYIIGGGDPTIASGDNIAPHIDTLFAQWRRALSKAGIREIRGSVIGDGRFFDGPTENDSWQYNDLGTYYGTGGNGLCFYINAQDIIAKPAAIVGDTVSLSVSYPKTPWMTLENAAVTAPAGKGDNLYLYCTEFAPTARMRGFLAIDKGTRKEGCSNKFGALTCAWYFAQYLKDNGIVVENVGDIDELGRIRKPYAWQTPGVKGLQTGSSAAPDDNLTIICETESPRLLDIATITNLRSDNFYAETLLRILSKEETGSADHDACVSTAFKEFEKLGLNTSYGIQLQDGSGLSRKNYISPDFFCRFLKAMSVSDCSAEYISCISSPSASAMSNLVPNLPAATRSRIHMKSGSMNGVLCYSGYILPANGNPKDTVIFSIMTNNLPGKTSTVREMVNSLLTILAE